jgi:hypothetical protein
MRRLALAAVAALAVAAAACGGVENAPNLAAAIEKTETSGSFAFEMTSRTSDGESFSGTCEGVVDNVRELARVTCGSDADSAFGSFEAITVGDASYRKARDEQTWTKEPAVDDASLDEFSPITLLELLRSASQKTERTGEEEVRGDSTARYALTVDCEQAELHDCRAETAVVHVWIDSDGLVRRIRVDQIALAFDLEFFDFGVPVEVEAPPADQVVDQPPPAPLETQPCAAVAAEPLRVDQVREALGRNGFEPSVAEGGCLEPPLAAFISAERAGAYLRCHVVTTPDAGLVPLPSIGLPEARARTAANVTCALYGQPEDTRDVLSSFDAAFDEVERELRE